LFWNLLLQASRARRTKWLGFTFRLSKTIVQYPNEQVYFGDGETPLTVADDEQRALFFWHCKTENEESYPTHMSA